MNKQRNDSALGLFVTLVTAGALIYQVLQIMKQTNPHGSGKH